MTDFNTYWKTLTAAQKRDLAERSGISMSYLTVVTNGHRRAGWKTIRRLMNADELITVEMFDSAA